MSTFLKCLIGPTKDLLFPQLERPTGFFARNNGLMFRAPLSESSAFMITGCGGIGWIHTFFMKFPIDIIYLNKKMKIIKVKKNVKPNRLTMPVLGTHSVIECSGCNSKLDSLNIGDSIYVEA